MSGGKSITWCKDKNTFDVFPMLEGYIGTRECCNPESTV